MPDLDAQDIAPSARTVVVATSGGAIHPIIERAGLSVVAEVNSASGALRETLAARPDVCLLEVGIKGDLARTVQIISQVRPNAHIVIVSPAPHHPDLAAAVQAGATSALIAPTNGDAVEVSPVIDGEPDLPSEIAAALQSGDEQFTPALPAAAEHVLPTDLVVAAETADVESETDHREAEDHPQSEASLSPGSDQFEEVPSTERDPAADDTPPVAPDPPDEASPEPDQPAVSTAISPSSEPDQPAVPAATPPRATPTGYQRSLSGKINCFVFYVPRFIRHFRRRRLSQQTYSDAWASTRERMRSY